MKSTLAGWLLCVIALVGSGIWIGRRSVDAEEIRRGVIQELATCTIERAHRGECWLPCASDEDCLAKNGKGDR